jgi:hypothetical protein
MLDIMSIGIVDAGDLAPLIVYAVPELRDVLEDLAPGGTRGDMNWSYSVETQSIFQVYCLRIWRN